MVSGTGDTEVKHGDDHPCLRGAGMSPEAAGGEGRPEVLCAPTHGKRLEALAFKSPPEASSCPAGRLLSPGPGCPLC